jgi:hypothetical protein
MSGIRLVLTAVIIPGCLGLASCAGPVARDDQGAASMHEITQWYQQATSSQLQADRWPARQQRQRAFRELAGTSRRMLADTQAWPTSPRLTAADGPSDREAQVRQLRSALEGVHEAAVREDQARLAREYNALVDAYRNLSSTGRAPGR